MTTDNNQNDYQQKYGVCLPAIASLSLVVIGWVVFGGFYLASPLDWPFPKLRAVLIIVCWLLSALIAGIVFFKQRSRSPSSRLLLMAALTISIGSSLVCSGPILGHLTRVQHYEHSTLFNNIRKHIKNADKCTIIENQFTKSTPSHNECNAPVSIAEEILAIAFQHMVKNTPDTAVTLIHKYELTFSENDKDIYTIKFDRMSYTDLEHNIISYFTATPSGSSGIIELTTEGGKQIKKLLQEAMQKKTDHKWSQ